MGGTVGRAPVLPRVGGGLISPANSIKNIFNKELGKVKTSEDEANFLAKWQDRIQELPEEYQSKAQSILNSFAEDDEQDSYPVERLDVNLISNITELHDMAKAVAERGESNALLPVLAGLAGLRLCLPGFWDIKGQAGHSNGNLWVLSMANSGGGKSPQIKRAAIDWIQGTVGNPGIKQLICGKFAASLNKNIARIKELYSQVAACEKEQSILHKLQATNGNLDAEQEKMEARLRETLAKYHSDIAAIRHLNANFITSANISEQAIINFIKDNFHNGALSILDEEGGKLFDLLFGKDHGGDGTDFCKMKEGGTVGKVRTDKNNSGEVEACNGSIITVMPLHKRKILLSESMASGGMTPRFLYAYSENRANKIELESVARESSKVWGTYAAEIVMAAYDRVTIDEESGKFNVPCQNYKLSSDADKLVYDYERGFCQTKQKHYGAIISAIPFSADKLKIQQNAAIALQSLAGKFFQDVYGLAAALHVASFPDHWYLPEHSIISADTIEIAIALHKQSFLNAEYLFTNNSDKAAMAELVEKQDKNYDRFLNALKSVAVDGKATRAAVCSKMGNRDFKAADIDAFALKAESENLITIDAVSAKTVNYIMKGGK